MFLRKYDPPQQQSDLQQRATMRCPICSGGLTFLLKQLQKALRATIDEALAPAGLTFPEAAVLSELSLVSRRSNAELARASFVTPQSMVTLLKSLEARGLIARQPSPEGGRARPAGVTSEGTKQLMVFRLAMREVEHRLLRSLPPSIKDDSGSY